MEVSEDKRYYWLKLKEDFFEDDTIQWLEEQENGKEYTLFYLKLCLKSLNLDGRIIRIVGEKIIPFDKKALAKVTNTDIDTVTIAMNLFVQIGLIDLFNSGEIYMKQINEMVGSETKEAIRKRKYRANLKQGDIVPELSQNGHKKVPDSIESRDKSIESRDKSIDDDKNQNSENNKLKKSSKTNNNDNKLNPLSFYENNGFGTLSPIVRDKIEAISKDFIQEGSSKQEADELIIKALELSAINNVRKWSYAEKVLINWNNKGHKTVKDVDAAEKNYQSRKGNTSYNQLNKTTPEEDEETKEFVRKSKERLAEDVAKFKPEDFDDFF